MTPGRQFFRPKFKELPQQCASCPFRVGNNAEFGEVVNRLRRKEGIDGPADKATVGFARMELFKDASRCGDFICHGTAYNREMEQNPQSEFRQCPGATHVYKTGKLPL